MIIAIPFHSPGVGRVTGQAGQGQGTDRETGRREMIYAIIGRRGVVEAECGGV